MIDSKENIRKTAELAVEVKAEKLSLLPYHTWGEQKYGRLGREYPMGAAPAMQDEEANHCQEGQSGPGPVQRGSRPKRVLPAPQVPGELPGRGPFFDLALLRGRQREKTTT
jgi:hypothetical protein